MNLKKNKTLLILICIFFLVQVKISAVEKNSIKYTFTQTDSSYSFYGTFKIKACASCLLDICFDYKHIKALSLEAKEVKLIDQGSDWNKIQYTYQKFRVFENISVWYRKADNENQRVDITLVSTMNNQAIMPGMISSSGYFHIFKQGDDMIVEYYQQCQLTKKIFTNLFISAIKAEMIHFIKWFSEYANTICGDKPLT